MKRLFTTVSILVYLLQASASARASEPIRHHLSVSIYPLEHRFLAQDTVTIPEDFTQGLEFLLHDGLNPSSPTAGVTVSRGVKSTGPVPLESFKVALPPGQRTFVLSYGGEINHPLEPFGREQARGFRQTPGTISAGGVYLSGSSFWYPRFHEKLVTFALHAELPLEWDAVSQGERTKHVRKDSKTLLRWESPHPQDEIFMVAAPFIEYSKPAGRVTAMAFLRTPDEQLAARYLDAAANYLAMYEKLIGPYPYGKFALVENFWETGLGMPSFTLLGPKVIRFPFILHSSFPHEILHNWWGNSVFPNLSSGNWSEGLTAYLADHLIKEQRGNGAEHRQATLQKYADYVLGGRDFPLTHFRARHSTSSEAVGYGKALMFFHMLRRKLGDKNFVKGLQDFYRKKKFRFASFDDLRMSFEAVSGKSLKGEFDQWITRPGAPQIKVIKAQSTAGAEGYVLTALLEQVQPGDAYHLRIPIVVTLEGQDRAFETIMMMDSRRVELNLRLPARPLRLDVDPEFDLFRRLDRGEIPPALTQTLGAKKMLVLLPSSADHGLLQAYREFSLALGKSGPDEVDIRLDREVEKIPSDRAVAIIGWENRFLDEMRSALAAYEMTVGRKVTKLGTIEIPRENHSLVLTARHPGNEDLSLTWVASDRPEALPGLGRKLPHYHKYSYLGFRGEEPTNVVKGRWPVLHSPMTVIFPQKDRTVRGIEMGEMPKREPLAHLPEVFSKRRMMETAAYLSSEQFEGRGFGTRGLDLAADYIARKFSEAGLLPAGDSEGSYFQIWQEKGGDPESTVIMRNVIGMIPGIKSELKDRSIVIGAHYDHLGPGWPDVRDVKYRGKIHPGADDNASGVAVLIELAGVLAKGLKPHRNVFFVAFAGEEAGKMGSKHYVANQSRYPPSQCMAMINIDTVGRLGKGKLLVLGAGSASEWVHIFRGAGYVIGVDVETVSADLDSSDQKSFHEAGIPAVQLFSGPHLDYHRPTDTADKLDGAGLLKVASVVKEVAEYLAYREEPLTTTLEAAGRMGSTPKGKRKVSFGTIPDFAYTREGYRISGVVPGSPAESCGLRGGDVIVKVNSDSIKDLKGFSDALKALHPGETISVVFVREGKEMIVETEVKGR